MAEIFKTFMAEAEKLDPEGFAKARAERAELEALRKDAERWRWWRAQVWGFRALGSARPAVFAYPSAMELPPVRGDIMRGSVAEHFDHAVDAAMAERKARELAAGRVQWKRWVHPDDVPALTEYADKLARKRARAEQKAG
jgi:hypothetical protein